MQKIRQSEPQKLVLDKKDEPKYGGIISDFNAVNIRFNISLESID